MKTRLLSFALLLLALPLFAAEPPQDIVAFAERLLREFPETPSVGLAVVVDGKPLVVRGIGVRDVVTKAPADAKTGYYIASSTKSYLGTLAALLATRGVVDLDKPVTQYLPELRLPDGLAPDRVTLRTLLSHTSGLRNDAIVARTAFTGDHTPALLTNLVARSGVADSKFAYDNLGYVVGALVLERVTGKKWQDLLDRELFTPLGMHRTTAYMSEAKKGPMASPHWNKPDEAVARIDMMKTDATMHAAGGLVTTPEDLARWLEANLNGGRVGGKQALPKAAFEIAQKPYATMSSDFYRFKRRGYGLGWYDSDFEGETLIHHFGGFEGWKAHVSFMPQHRIGVAVVANVSGLGGRMTDVLAAYVYERLLGKPSFDATYAAQLTKERDAMTQAKERVRADIERRAKRTSMLQHEANAYAGTYANALYGTVTITPELVASLGQLKAKLEPFTEPESARVELIPGTGEVLRFTVTDGKAASVKWRDEVFERVK
jgi:CubicO group peptidase (beta-lactamase class C family)